MMNTDDVLTVAEVCDLLKLSKSTVLKLINQKKIKAVRIGRIWRIYNVAVEEYLRNNAGKPYER